MIGTSVLPQPHTWTPIENLPQSTEVSASLKEQQCLALLKACNNLQELKQVHAQVLKRGFLSNSFVASNLMATCVLSHWGSMDYACSLFRSLDEPGTFNFNIMIRGYTLCDSVENALFLYCEMLENGVQSDNFTYPYLLKACAVLKAIKEGEQIHGHVFKLGYIEDLFVQNSLINMYGKCEKIDESSTVFNQMCHKDTASWSAIIAAHANLRMWHECLRLFGEMSNEGFCRPEESIMVSVLSASAHLGALDFGKCAHGSLLRNITQLNVTVLTCLINMYVKCGCIDKALSIFRTMKNRNRLSYSAMISGLAMHRRGREALGFFSEMLEEGLDVDDVVYVGVLSACSHGGLISEGLQLFNKMKVDHRIEPTIQHYGCMVDLMGRAGMLKEALNFIRNMLIEANDIVWRSLLTSCRVHDNLEIADIVAQSLLQLNANNPSDHLVLCNMHARAKRWEEAAKIRTEMFGKGIKQTPGFSLVEVKRQFHKFVSQDRSHPQHEQIYEMIHQMEWQLKFEGYSPDTTQILLDVDENEKRLRLKAHSQKLALAFSLIHIAEGSPIRITRNNRMCNDCHMYTKYISRIYNREIIVSRDGRRGGPAGARAPPDVGVTPHYRGLLLSSAGGAPPPATIEWGAPLYV